MTDDLTAHEDCVDCAGFGMVMKFGGPDDCPNLDAHRALARLAQEATPPIPPELCGINSCAFTPHPDGTAHTWADRGNTRRIYTTDAHGCGIRREPDDADVAELEKAGRKVFTTKGSAG